MLPVSGNWTQDLTLTGWAKILNSVAHIDDIAEFSVDTDNETSRVLSASLLPAAVILLGVVLAMVVVIRLCCCSPVLSDKRGKVMTPSLVWGSLAFVFTALAFVLFVTTSRRGGESATESVSEFMSDTHNASNITLGLKTSATNILHDLNALLDGSCDFPQQVVDQLTPYKHQIRHAANESSALHRDIEFFLNYKLDNFQEWGGAKALWNFIIAALSLPLILICLTCAGMLFVLLGTNCLKQGSSCAKCEDIVFFKIGALGLALTILCVAAVSSSQLATGIVLSSFCSDADANTLLVLRQIIGPDTPFYKTNSHEPWEAAQYYIGANGSNPYMARVMNVSTDIDSASDIAPLLETGVKVYCPQDVMANHAAQHIGGNLTTAQKQINDTATILQPTNIYHYYADAMHGQICGPVIAGLGWVSFFQIIVGMICLPFLSCTVEAFVHHRAFAAVFREQQQEENLLDEPHVMQTLA